MKVAELRRRILGTLDQVAAGEDEFTTAEIADYSRAILVALTGRRADEEIALNILTVGTKTLAMILRMNVEYVRELVRCKVLPGEKENGEYRIPMSAS